MQKTLCEQFQERNYETGILLNQSKQKLLAEILDLIKSSNPQITVFEVFEILDQTKDFILKNKTLRD